MECFKPAFRRRNVGAEGRFHLQKSAADGPFRTHPTVAYQQPTNPQNQATVDFSRHDSDVRVSRRSCRLSHFKR